MPSIKDKILASALCAALMTVGCVGITGCSSGNNTVQVDKSIMKATETSKVTIHAEGDVWKGNTSPLYVIATLEGNYSGDDIENMYVAQFSPNDIVSSGAFNMELPSNCDYSLFFVSPVSEDGTIYNALCDGGLVSVKDGEDAETAVSFNIIEADIASTVDYGEIYYAMTRLANSNSANIDKVLLESWMEKVYAFAAPEGALEEDVLALADENAHEPADGIAEPESSNEDAPIVMDEPTVVEELEIPAPIGEGEDR